MLLRWAALNQRKTHQSDYYPHLFRLGDVGWGLSQQRVGLYSSSAPAAVIYYLGRRCVSQLPGSLPHTLPWVALLRSIILVDIL